MLSDLYEDTSIATVWVTTWYHDNSWRQQRRSNDSSTKRSLFHPNPVLTSPLETYTLHPHGSCRRSGKFTLISFTSQRVDYIQFDNSLPSPSRSPHEASESSQVRWLCIAGYVLSPHQFIHTHSPLSDLATASASKWRPNPGKSISTITSSFHAVGNAAISWSNSLIVILTILDNIGPEMRISPLDPMKGHLGLCYRQSLSLLACISIRHVYTKHPDSGLSFV